ncbi:MAG TPA: tripartite tricarboxylate transporter substrate binding protein [Anaeromyxobacter sp.]
MRAFARIASCIAAMLVLDACRERGAQGERWPTQPIHFIAPFAPGGPVDTIARKVGQKLSEELGQPVVVENRPGAGGNIGTAAAAKSAPDGYTVLVTSTAFAVNATLSAKPGYDAERDFVPIAIVATQPNAIIVNASLPAQDLAQLLALAKATSPGFATPGSGTTPHLTGEHLFRSMAKLDMTPIHFKGAGPAVIAVLSGQPPIGSAAISTALQHIRSGKLRALAVSSARRAKTLPDVPTLAEVGFPGVEDYTWVGLFLPAGTPPEIVQRLNAAVNRVLSSPQVRAQLEEEAFEPVGGSSRSSADYVKAEVEKWGKLVREVGIQAE